MRKNLCVCVFLWLLVYQRSIMIILICDAIFMGQNIDVCPVQFIRFDFTFSSKEKRINHTYWDAINLWHTEWLFMKSNRISTYESLTDVFASKNKYLFYKSSLQVWR